MMETASNQQILDTLARFLKQVRSNSRTILKLKTSSSAAKSPSTAGGTLLSLNRSRMISWTITSKQFAMLMLLFPVLLLLVAQVYPQAAQSAWKIWPTAQSRSSRYNMITKLIAGLPMSSMTSLQNKKTSPYSTRKAQRISMTLCFAHCRT